MENELNVIKVDKTRSVQAIELKIYYLDKGQIIQKRLIHLNFLFKAVIVKMKFKWVRFKIWNLNTYARFIKENILE